MNQTIGKQIVQNRKRLGLTQEQLAEKLGVTAQAVSKWEHNQSCPDISVLPQLADIFGITVDELLGRAKPDPVFEGEIYSDNENPDAAKKGTLELTWDPDRKNAIAIAVFILFSGLLYLLSQVFTLEISFWDILWPSALAFFGITGLSPKFSFFRLGCFLLGAYFLIGKIVHIPFKLDSGVIFAVVVVLFGASLLMDAIKKSKKHTFNVSYTDKFGKVHHGKRKTDLEYTDQGFYYSACFGEANQVIYLDTLNSGSISTSFGEYTVDLTQIKNVTADSSLDVSCSFGELIILVPKHIGIRVENSSTFANIHTDGFADQDTTSILNIEASASFGEIEIRHI